LIIHLNHITSFSFNELRNLRRYNLVLLHRTMQL
jgi:hypothetical protein